MDQRRAESLNRFLMRRAMGKMKNPEPLAKPIAFFHPSRWEFAIKKRSITIRAGMIGLNLYWHAVVPVPNNISVEAETTGLILFFIPLGIVNGAVMPARHFAVMRGGKIVDVFRQQ